MSNFNRFREKNNYYKEASQKINSHFLIKGYPSITITDAEDNEKQAVVVNQQEKEKAYIYTALQDELSIGSIWQAKSLHFLISEEIIIIKDVDWHKYLAFLCNVELEDTWGYFIGLKKRVAGVDEEYSAAIESKQKPLLILPANILEYEDTVVIKGRPWLVQEYDAISTPGLVYYSLAPTTASLKQPTRSEPNIPDSYIIKKQSKPTELILEPEEVIGAEEKYAIAYNQDMTITTEKGYFKYSNKAIKIKKHTATEVVFCLPFGVKEVTIESKERGEVVVQTFVAVE